uniref:Putative secreted protein n=1 Tax=Amblyomma americanum TaxID=6943 RepID=A0A0C9RW54_AMBAM
MAKPLILAVALMACIVLGEGRTEIVTSLQFGNGTCTYQGNTLKQGETKYSSEYCEYWKCNAKKKILAVRGRLAGGADTVTVLSCTRNNHTPVCKPCLTQLNKRRELTSA